LPDVVGYHDRVCKGQMTRQDRSCKDAARGAKGCGAGIHITCERRAFLVIEDGAVLMEVKEVPRHLATANAVAGPFPLRLVLWPYAARTERGFSVDLAPRVISRVQQLYRFFALACLCARLLILFAESAGWACAGPLCPFGFAALLATPDENQAFSLENVSRIILEPITCSDEIGH
jgi:hypothetical protein